MSAASRNLWQRVRSRLRDLRPPHFKRYFITGLLTVFPVWLTWVVFSFVLRQLSRLGAPVVDGVLTLFAWMTPGGDVIRRQEWLQFSLAVLLTVAFLYLLGWLANRVVGRQLLAIVDSWIERIPLVQTIYGGTKKLLKLLQKKPESTQRVVFIDFPKENMKVVGLVTRVLREEGTGRELAAVYVPTTPNPTSGYLEIVPVTELTPTTWTVDQAMAFVISGGAVSPDEIPFTPPAARGEPLPDLRPVEPMEGEAGVAADAEPDRGR